MNAVAGSGKTTTIIEYAQARPKQSKILYLAFNKSVKLEATKKFADKGLDNVKVETAHSIAYKHIVFKNNYKVRPRGYKTHEIAELLGLEGNGEKHAEYIAANHINKFISYFCNSEKKRVQDLNYLEIISDPKAKAFVSNFYEYIEKQTRMLLSKMDKGEIEITHDFYLKKFQLSNPKLNYDYILFDEGQDASAAMLDVFFKQKATKVIVGDTHQQIYGWRFAINSLEKADKKNAEMIFSTVHRCKGMEYDAIQIVNDFISEEKLEKFVPDIRKDNLNFRKLNEEINLLYVAITRAKSSIHIPEPLMPVDFPPSKQIHIPRVAKKEEGQVSKPTAIDKTKVNGTEKAYSVDEVRTRHKDAYKPWTQELDDELTIMYCEGVNVKDLAIHFGRTKGAIRSRIKKLELKKLYG
ncbi:MAG: UvrD-helicase domain-containing protein [Bacteroidota bacterium]